MLTCKLHFILFFDDFIVEYIEYRIYSAILINNNELRAALNDKKTFSFYVQ